MLTRFFSTSSPAFARKTLRTVLAAKSKDKIVDDIFKHVFEKKELGSAPDSKEKAEAQVRREKVVKSASREERKDSIEARPPKEKIEIPEFPLEAMKLEEDLSKDFKQTVMAKISELADVKASSAKESDWYLQDNIVPVRSRRPEQKQRFESRDMTEIDNVVQELKEGLAKDICVIDMTEKSPVAEAMVIATGRTPKHIYALAQSIKLMFKHIYNSTDPFMPENLSIHGQETDWMTVDVGRIIVHCMTAEAREKYDLEGLWVNIHNEEASINNNAMNEDELADRIFKEFSKAQEEANLRKDVKIKSIDEGDIPSEADIYKVIDHYENPRNVGSLNKNDPNVGTGLVGAPACGDVMKLQILVDDNGEIKDARFKTFGCGSAIASSSFVTTKLKGLKVWEAANIKNTEIAKELSLPPVKLHCSMLAEDAIKEAVKNWEAKKKQRESTKELSQSA